MNSRPSNATTVLAGGELRYSTVWEDHRLLERGLKPGPNDTLLVIASAGDNVLNLLLREPKRIVAIDINPAQTALLELKLAAIKHLDHTGLTRLLGVAPAAAAYRLASYQQLRGRLSEASRAWWDAHSAYVGSGISEAGLLDGLIVRFRRAVLAGRPEGEAAAALLGAKDLAERRRHAERMFSAAFESAFMAAFGAARAGTEGRDASQMRFVSEPEARGAELLARFKRTCVELPTAGNFYLARVFLGDSEPKRGPPYLRPSHFARLRGLTPRVELVTAELGDYLRSLPPACLSHAALSDLFEYLSEAETAALFDELARVIRPGGRIAYWNLFVPRSGSATSKRIRALESLSRRLTASDRAWFYRSFHVEEVLE